MLFFAYFCVIFICRTQIEMLFADDIFIVHCQMYRLQYTTVLNFQVFIFFVIHTFATTLVLKQPNFDSDNPRNVPVACFLEAPQKLVRVYFVIVFFCCCFFFHSLESKYISNLQGRINLTHNWRQITMKSNDFSEEHRERKCKNRNKKSAMANVYWTWNQQ